jgi:hypothetical protein
MQFQRDATAVPLPEAGLTETLGEVIETLAVGESGCVEAKLATVRTLLSRHVARKRVAAAFREVGEPGYSKRFIARATTDPGVIRVWRVG